MTDRIYSKDEALRQRLLYQWNEATATFTIHNGTPAVDRSQGHLDLADRAANLSLVTVDDRIAELEQRQIGEVVEAIERIESGDYGTCQRCGDLIDNARLEAIPTASRCLDCQSKTETTTRRDY